MFSLMVRSILRTVTEAGIRKAQMSNDTMSQMNASSSAEIQKLRDEISQLRETTTQHALSLQHSVERLDHRVEFIERTALQNRNGVDNSQQIVGRS